MDRIDELADGEHLIIDYKTSKNNNINTWFSDRPEEPQLPLYLLQSKQGSGITFAQISPGDYQFIGLSGDDLQIKGIRQIHQLKNNAAHWNEQLVNWKNHFEKLSHEFTSGFAIVNPKDKNKVCLWCHLQPLCRIHEVIDDH